MTDVSRLKDEVRLPCGVVLPNRLCKAAMTEGLADKRNRPREEHVRLYDRWSKSGVGLHLTGNVQVDRKNLERPGNVVIDRAPDAEMMGMLSRWASAAKSGGAKIFMQVSHAGRQTPIFVNATPDSASDIPLALPGKQFGKPKPLTEAGIESIIARFAIAGRAARDAGFDGIQVHGAHGYLISQFLSPLSNKRTDAWGGALENRARILLEIVRRVRDAVGPDFAVAVKMNTADFQKGGFAEDDAITVARWLDEAGIDLLEISGGTYEQPKMVGLEGLEGGANGAGSPPGTSTSRREAYFLDHTPRLRAAVKCPVMVTGGFRTAQAMVDAVTQDSIDVIGIGRPLCVAPETVAVMLAGRLAELPRAEDGLKLGGGFFGPNSPVGMMKMLNTFGTMAWYYQQIFRMGRGQDPDPKMSVFGAFASLQLYERRLASQLTE